MNKSYILIILLLIIIVSCKHSTEPEFLDEFPTLLLKSVCFESENAEFYIVNNTDELFYFNGWFKNSPIYGFETLQDTGWAYCGPLWCGTGLIEQKLKPSQKISINTYINDIKGNDAKWRLVINFRSSNQNEWIKVHSKEYRKSW